MYTKTQIGASVQLYGAQCMLWTKVKKNNAHNQVSCVNDGRRDRRQKRKPRT